MKNKKKVAIAALGMAGVLTLGASLAYFTDRADTNATGTAGTVAIDLNSDVDLKDADGKDILNPGDERDASFKITNLGNKSIRVRETLVLEAFESDGTTPKALTEDSGQAQYELYKASDVEPDANGSYKPKAGASPLTVRTADLAHGKITYDIPEYILNGSSTKGKSEGVGFRAQNPGESDTDYAVAMAAYKSANIEDDTRRELETGITTIQHDGDYVLVFRGNSANDWQNSVVKLSCVANALQKRNTGNDTWTTIKSETITFGGMDTAVVPVETTISDGNATAANAGTP